MKTLDSHEFTRAPGLRTGSKHDWNTYLDGQIRQFDIEDMGNSQPKFFVHQARNQAKKRDKGLRAQVVKDGDEITGVILQAVPLNAAESNGQTEAPPAATKPSKKGKGK